MTSLAFELGDSFVLRNHEKNLFLFYNVIMTYDYDAQLRNFPISPDIHTQCITFILHGL